MSMKYLILWVWIVFFKKPRMVNEKSHAIGILEALQSRLKSRTSFVTVKPTAMQYEPESRHIPKICFSESKGTGDRFFCRFIVHTYHCLLTFNAATLGSYCFSSSSRQLCYEDSKRTKNLNIGQYDAQALLCKLTSIDSIRGS